MNKANDTFRKIVSAKFRELNYEATLKLEAYLDDYESLKKLQLKILPQFYSLENKLAYLFQDSVHHE